MKREDLRMQEEALVMESLYKRPRPLEPSRKRRRRREDLPSRLYRYLRELDR